MVEYELLYLVGESKDAELPHIREDVEQLVTSHGGTFLLAFTEEKRKMAYVVKNEVRGTYIARRFTLPDKDERDEQGIEQTVHPLTEINRALQLSKDILRSLIVNADDMPELKAIPREERPRTENRGNRYEKRGAVRPMPIAPIAPKEEEKKVVTEEEMDAQLKEKLDI
ncbi:MAG: 30S ribosomal protein S6 [Candidatus Moranbacteria bacterium]|nr:30S ribosomal protein S6 [Candidatus Moranbacteria bacterium]